MSDSEAHLQQGHPGGVKVTGVDGGERTTRSSTGVESAKQVFEALDERRAQARAAGVVALAPVHIFDQVTYRVAVLFTKVYPCARKDVAAHVSRCLVGGTADWTVAACVTYRHISTRPLASSSSTVWAAASSLSTAS